MPETIARCIIRAPDRRTVTVFVIPSLSPEAVEATLQKASARLPGTKILTVKLGAAVNPQADGNQYLFGTGGVLQFLDAQSNQKLEAAVRLVADVFLAEHFQVVEPLEVVPASTQE